MLASPPTAPMRHGSRACPSGSADEHLHLLIIDPKLAQCVDGSCSTSIDGMPVYRDVGHLTDFASRQFGLRYPKQLGNPLNAREAPSLANNATTDSEKEATTTN